MTNRHVKRCSKAAQNQSLAKYKSNHKLRAITNVGKDVEKLDPYAVLVEM